MDPEEIITLLDSYWFNQEIFKKKPQQTPNSKTNPDHQNQTNQQEPNILSLHVRSKSDQLVSMPSFSSDSLSPNSVLFTPQEEEPKVQPPIAEQQQEQPKKGTSRRRRTKKGMTKSLSNLEFEELKGFLDLGFVFSEEDVNSSLVEIIPGLQRLKGEQQGTDCKEGEEQGTGCEEGEKQGTSGGESSVQRPYLSEAWEVWERERREKPLMNWRFPDVGNEIGMKDSLKWWAHTVASTVR
ncbi:Protein of unknown function DUF1685 protein [Actinidia chinensis var. chinensis]|uniref:Uncharacterized protein n=1 Tax=Actinidia chinensis var. chinensis TaxID=1590841 RepID=A0A2R6RG99_ACTCC|nr:Protein of unknown function DUF1685 protein [Actinidia chinensis var. chinensis]